MGGWLWAPVIGRAALWVGLFVALAHVGAGSVGRLIGAAPVAAAAERLSGHADALEQTDGNDETEQDELGCEPGLDGGVPGSARDGGGPQDGGAPVSRLEDGRIVLNAASVAELATLPSIGPKRAEAIVALRAKLGRFRRIEDLRRVRGIGPKALARLRPLVVVDPPAPRPESP